MKKSNNKIGKSVRNNLFRLGYFVVSFEEAELIRAKYLKQGAAAGRDRAIQMDFAAKGCPDDYWD